MRIVSIPYENLAGQLESEVKVLLAYDSKYGNTKLVAENIAEGMKSSGGIETAIRNIKEIDIRKMGDYDAILFGAPVHFGAPSRAISKFIDNVGKLNLEGKLGAVFDTYYKTDFERGVKPMEARLGEKAPKLKLVAPGLSIQVKEIKGPITEGELPKCVDYGKEIAAKLTGLPKVAPT